MSRMCECKTETKTILGKQEATDKVLLVQDEIPSLEMKNFLVLSVLLLLITFIGLICSSKDVKQACEENSDTLLCGDVCLKKGKTCTCGNSSFTVRRKPQSTEVCCAPEGSCIKDTNGKYPFEYGNCL